MTYVVFVWTPSGYELREADGEPPKVGDELEIDERKLRVTKLGVSPLPGDQRIAAYTLA